MTVKDGKIVEATENELFGIYLKREFDDIMPFDQYLYLMVNAGCVVKNNPCN